MIMLCLSLFVQAQKVILPTPPMWEIFATEDKTIGISAVDVLNSSTQDYCAIEYSAGLLFSTNRQERDSNHQDDSNFYYSAYTETGIPDAPVFYQSSINSVLKEGVATVSPDGQELVFSRAEPGTKRVHLYSAENLNGQWQNISKLSINVAGYLSGHPAFSADGKRIYFASNRPGGLGGTDLYYSDKKDGDWAGPVNLGPVVNSPHNELYPFMDKDKGLYFSSNRTGGNGGLDIYMTYEQSPGNWQIPLNPGLALNSPKDDFGIYIFKNRYGGYLSSDREGGKGGSDIYQWELEDCISIAGQLVNKNKQALPIENVRITANDSKTNASLETRTDKTGKFEFCLACQAEYSIKAFPEGFYLNEIFISTKNRDCKRPEPMEAVIQLFEIETRDIARNNPNTNEFKTTQPLNGKELKERNEKNKAMLESISIAEDIAEGEGAILTEEGDRKFREEKAALIAENTVEAIDNTTMKLYPEIPHIYHDFDSYRISEKDHQYLDDLVSYLKINPALKLAVNSYTDITGTEVYNNWLSDQRAGEVQNYLVERGIESSRIIAEGRGEDMASKKLPESRRTEFLIINEDVSGSDDEYSENIINTEIAKIHYGFDAYLLDKAARKEVELVIEKLKEHPDWQLEIVSHTDSRGSKVYNRRLSEKRAGEVRRFILSKGISGERVTATGKGEAELLNECSDSIGCSRSQHLKNRRTEFVFRY